MNSAASSDRGHSPSSPRPHSEAGFVLPTTLWILAFAALAVGLLASDAARRIEEAGDARARAHAALALATARADVLFALSTARTDARGAVLATPAAGLLPDAEGAVLRFDGRPYAFGGEAVVSVQDAAGLINLLYADRGDLQRLLAGLGIADGRRSDLVVSLERHLGRARAPEAPPLARVAPGVPALLTPWQLRRLPGWGGQPALWRDDALARLTTVGPSTAINPNTAPAEVLRAAFGLSPAAARDAVARRDDAPFRSAADLVAAGADPVLATPARVLAFATGSFHIALEARSARLREAMSIVLTPDATGAPWQIDYRLATVPAAR